ncbi:Ku protein [Pseudorhodoplanes sinuspersici]|uniref:Non-homologous end joining protein Ku n=1 Tax=Pseudorhodoplanes sinuspersici TaxID=1235591 RepID=A0A1W6ZW27_9HYPH|nr:Ku protein [Pseudorhodoplanes sinuspersici]ARQ01513.1 Ku protein [Pseudorhodoplanes sinuspersici]RKE73215.1 DNA end-binding protein Ku [Pseudorhodoplanes sinuspersici]
MATRAYWSGRIRLALVSIPVEVVSATKTSSRISFHQIHEPSGKRIRYEKVVPGIGPVDTDEIVKGYEVEKGKYVLLSDEEIADVKLEAKKSIDLVQFVDADAIEQIYFEKPFYILPSEEDEDAEEAYIVLRDALKKTNKIGLGQIVVRGQGSIVAIKPFGKGLLMETLRYADEVKKADTVFEDVPAKKVDADLIDLAEELIDKKSGEFHPEKFKDTYTVALRELIKAKQENRPPREIEEAPPASNVINLMDALKRSVRGGSAETTKAEKSESGGTRKAARKTKSTGKPAKKSARKTSGRRRAA